jgi:hypothetical protein
MKAATPPLRRWRLLNYSPNRAWKLKRSRVIWVLIRNVRQWMCEFGVGARTDSNYC